MQEEYETAFQTLVKDPESEAAQGVRDRVLDRHNEYVLQLKAANRTIEQFKHTLPEVLEVSGGGGSGDGGGGGGPCAGQTQRVCAAVEGRQQDHRAVQAHSA